MKILLVVYDNDAFISFYPIGISYLAAAARDAGHDVSIYNQDVYHYTEEHLTEYINNNGFDVVGVGACGGYYQYNKVKKICDAVNKCRIRPTIVLGGHLASPEPKFFLKKMQADFVVIGEGEVTFTKLLYALENKKSLANVDGIAYFDGDVYVQTKKRELISDINSISFPAWDLLPMEHYVMLRFPNIKRNQRSMSVLSGRGCPFTCNFCYRIDEGFRPRSLDSILEEMQILIKDYKVSYFAFADELLMNSADRTIELCEGFIKADLNINWECCGRLNYAKPDVLKLMKESGCVFINYGIESYDDEALKRMNKALTVKQINEGIENTLAVGISPGYNIIFGNIGESKETLQKGVEFLLKYDDHSQMRTIRPVTPYPGSPLYYYAIEKGLIKDIEDFYEVKHTNSDLLTVNFTDLTDDEFYDALYEANLTLLNNYYEHSKQKVLVDLNDLYRNRNTGFRGFRHT